MNNELTPGQPVEVLKIWASQGHALPVLQDWFAGYVLVCHEGRSCLVRATGGTFAGCEYRYPRSSVRPSTKE